MKHYTNKELADYVLEMRSYNGRAPSWQYFKKNKWSLISFFGLMAVLVGLCTFTKSWWLCGFVVGWVVGVLSRDRTHVKRLRVVWPFYDKVIDWLKVEKIAKGEMPV